MLKFHSFAFTLIILFNFQILILSTLANNQQIVDRTRGVSLSRKPLYPKKDTFTCIDGKKTIKYTQINDDYCDCEDGSDEPGTSACPNGIFHCNNAGHKPINIPSSRINDGLCDCCDGSDEYNNPSGNCHNDCIELGRAERQKERSKQELLKKGVQLRADLIAKGKTKQIERENRLAELEKRKSDAEAIKLEKERIKSGAESLENDALEVYRQVQEEEKRQKEEADALENRREAEEIFTKYDLNNDQMIEKSEIQSRLVFDRNADQVVDDEEARYFLDENDEVDKEKFLTISWARIKPYLMLDSGVFKPPQQNKDENEDNPDDEAELLNEEKSTDHEEGEDEEREDDDTGDGEVEEDHRHEDNQQHEYDPETQKLIEQANQARNEFNEAERTIREIETEMKDINDQNSKDYGVEQEFSVLDGICINYEDREYVYKLCPFDRASQQPRSGGSETRLGSWDQWNGKEYKYSHMLYNNGASCWNGPQRSALVQVECGLENRVTSVSEPNRCEYQFVFETPAACNLQKDADDEQEEYHDEL